MELQPTAAVLGVADREAVGCTTQNTELLRHMRHDVLHALQMET